MNTTVLTNDTAQQEQDKFRILSLTALLTGTLDITAAIVQTYLETGNGPARMLKIIASGIFGQEALDGGKLMMTWGIVFHFMIAFLFTSFLFLVYPKVLRWIKNKFLIAVAYGIFVWSVMHLVVVPLSITHKLPSDPRKMIIAALILVFVTGLPVSLIAHRFYSKRQKA